jgi:ABC-type amino acid transport substrate-binding protein
MSEVSRLMAAFAATILAAIGTANAQQALRVGLLDAEPGVVRDGNQVGGRDIDIWNAIAKDAGLQVTYVFMTNLPPLLTALDENKLDVVGWGVTPTPDTTAKYLLTDIILPTAEALVVPKADTRMYRVIDDAKSLRFATLKASPYADYLKKSGIANIKELDSIPDVVKAVASGEVEAAMFSGIIAGYLLKQGKLPNLAVVASYQPALSRPIMAAFPRTASENYNRANNSLKKLSTDGTMAGIKAKYGL